MDLELHEKEQDKIKPAQQNNERLETHVYHEGEDSTHNQSYQIALSMAAAQKHTQPKLIIRKKQYNWIIQ